MGCSWFQYLALLGGNGGVPVDEFGEDSAQGLDAQRQGRHVQQQHVGDVARQHAALDGGADGHGLVRVHRLAGSAAKQVLHRLLDLEEEQGVKCSSDTTAQQPQLLMQQCSFPSWDQ